MVSIRKDQNNWRDALVLCCTDVFAIEDAQLFPNVGHVEEHPFPSSSELPPAKQA